ncbi:MAG: protein kinase [bacterium]
MEHGPDPESAQDSSTGIGPGVLVGNYRVLRLLGQGGMGEVYLCRDVQLGRKVALKVVRQHLLGDRKSQEQFLQEARVTARFSHPHIVTVYGVGEHEGSLYVALEYLEGSTLADRLSEGRLGRREALRIGLAIAEALTEAHRHGVLHRDLKPQNVLVPRDGRLRVLDFGLARLVSGIDPAEKPPDPTRHSAVSAEIEALTETMEQVYRTRGKGLRGTPRYMAPEQWREESGTPVTDVWALGLILFELLAGRHPFKPGNLYTLLMQATEPEPVVSIGELDPELPDALVALVDRCVDKAPDKRPTASAVAAALKDQLAGAASIRSERHSPYRGLLPFSERHADLFFGRDAEVAQALERLRDEAVLPILGPSGAGKSSFVQAGVIPRLRERERWVVLSLRPGARPFETLAARLLAGETLASRTSASRVTARETLAETVADGASAAAPVSDPGGALSPSRSVSTSAPTAAASDQLAEQLRESPPRLALELMRRAETERARVLLFVDQLEELFTLVQGDDAEEVRLAFMEALCRAADDPGGPVRAIFTLRDDFLWRMAVGSVAREVLGRVLVLRPPSPQELVETLERPAARAGYHFEDVDLPLDMVTEIQGEAAALPLVQFTAQMLWERRDRNRKLLTRSAYEAIGGVSGALAHHTDAVLASLTADQERLARAIFVRLVTPESTRRVVSRGDLLEGLDPRAAEVLERFTQARAILQRKGRSSTRTAGEGAELELVHESLIRNWAQLATWLDESREERVFLTEIGEAAALWIRRGRLPSEVWTGEALQDARRRASRCEVVPESVAQFLSVAEQRARRGVRRRRLAVGIAFAVLAVVAVAALGIAGMMRRQERLAQRQKVEAQHQKRTAEEQRRTAVRQRAEAQREGARAAFARGAFVEARAKLRSALEIEDSALARALWWRLGRNPLEWSQPLGTWANRVALSPNGRRLAAGGGDGVVHLFDVPTGQRRLLRGHGDQVHAVAFGPAGRRLASASWSGEIRLWDASSGVLVRRWSAHRSGINMLVFDGRGARLASAGKDRVVRVWSVPSGALLQALKGHQGVVRDVQFSRDSKALVSAGDDRQVIVWDPKSGRRQTTIKAPTRVFSAAFRGDGQVVATGDLDGTIRLFEVPSGRAIGKIEGHVGRVRVVRFAPRDRWLASAGLDGEIRLWNPTTKRLHATLPGHEAGVYSLSFGARGKRLASVGTDRNVRLWAVDTARRSTGRQVHHGAVNGIAFSPDGRTLASAGHDRTVRLWDVARGVPHTVLRGHEERVYWVDYQAHGGALVSVSADRTVRLWDAVTGRLRRILRGHSARVYAAAFSPDGQRLATGGSERKIRLWDPVRSDAVAQLRGHRGSIMGLRFGPQSRRLASASSDRTVRIWDARTGRRLAVLTGHTSRIRGLAFSPDGKRLLSGSDDRTLRWWSLQGTGRLLQTMGPLKARAYWLDLSPDGKIIAAPCSDGLVRLLDASTGLVLIGLRGHHTEVNVARFHPGGRLLASSGDDGTVRLWDARRGRPVWRAPLLRATTLELFTHNGWLRLDRAPGKQRATTPPRAAWRRQIADNARSASESMDGRWLCVSTFDGNLEIWDVKRDARTLSRAVAGVNRTVALPGGRCVAFASGNAHLYSAPGGAHATHRLLASKVSGLARWGDEVLLAAGEQVKRFDARGVLLGTWPGGTGVTALSRIGDWLVLGFKDGGIELVPLAGQPQPKFSFEATPDSLVVRLIAGPKGTVVGGFANGVFGLWSLRNGALLYRHQLHGPVRHMVLQGPKLFVATELGQRVRLDLGPFHVPYCELLRQIWRAVPVSWEKGVAVRRRPPAGHRCSQTAP